ncbi:MAG TPA: SpoIID/LytB domain-containing protein [Candidatus Acidoferrum sp.]|nr:SpoIID/LytB domain-containing protein [Candidatus Acidoferrum sp.]
MKLRSAHLSSLFLLLPLSAASAQDVRVRLFSLHPPSAVTLKAASGSFEWRTCPACPRNTATLLAIEAAGPQLRIRDAGISREIYVAGSVRLETAGGPAFSMNFPLEVKAADGQLLLTVTVPLEDYVAAVLTGEGGSFRNDESLKAMAVVIRTYAMRFRGQHANDGFDFCDTTHCQVPIWNSVSPRVAAAVESTRDEILWFQGAAAAAYYHQNCGGTLAASNEAWPDVIEPYLRSRADPYCVTASPLSWESNLSRTDINAGLRQAGLTPPTGWSAIEVVSRSASGRAQRLRLAGSSSPDFLVSASSFRFAIDRALGWNKIRSDLYEVRNDGDHILFSGRGSGHGVGLCQAGADEMARQGKDYRQILDFYFPGTHLSKVSSQGWQTRTSDRFELVTTAPEQDSKLLADAEKILKEDEAAIGWKLPFRARLQVFPTLDRYRDTTGQPGWVAATTRSQTVRLQPVAELRRRSILESTLRHEFFHLLVESHARAETPLWFREGLVLYLSEPGKRNSGEIALTDEEMEAILERPASRSDQEKAYVAARERVAALIQQYGKGAVLDWLSSGIPSEVLAKPAAPSNQGASQHP